MKVLYMLLAIILLYLHVALKVSHYVYLTSKSVIDEEFHMPLGLKYCSFNLTEWDPKVTTLPGLYIWSMLVCGYIQMCNVWSLRLSVVLASVINVVLIFIVRRHWQRYESIYKRFSFMFCIATFPVMFFFSQLYYTDIPSMMVVNFFILHSLRGNGLTACLAGYFAFFFRQNNLIYVCFMGLYVFIGNCYKLIMQPYDATGQVIIIDYNFLYVQVKRFFRRGITNYNYWKMFYDCLIFAIPLLMAVAFVVTNEGVVVGDKSAHKFTVNFPQLFYFSLFTVFFAWPHFLGCIPAFIRLVVECPLFSFLSVMTIALIVQYNTVVHPYLLADNRHYLFYIWKAFFDTELKRVAWAPVYFFCMFSIQSLLFHHRDKRFFFIFPVLVVLLVCFQGLIDLRYFMTPYVLFRAFIREASYRELLLEFLFNVLILLITFDIFGTKEIQWTDYSEIQRLIY